MTRETMLWLNTNTLIGFTAKRGNAWSYRAELQGDESNHYVGAIPMADVQRRLFDWSAVERPVFVKLPNGTFSEVPGRKAISRDDNEHVMGIFSDSYAPHQFREVLLDNLGALLDTPGTDLAIGSSGLLKQGAVAWVSLDVEENRITPEGVEFRPHLLAYGSHDGSHATTYKPVNTNVVCDNTMAAAVGERDGNTYKFKHTRNSRMRIADARTALGIIQETGDAFAAEVKALCEIEVSADNWRRFLEAHAPIDTDLKGRGLTMAENKRMKLNQMWKSDARVSPWAGTAWGVVQAVNTYTHHEQTVRGTDRAERNMLRALSGGVEKLDTDTIETLNRVLTRLA